MTIEHRRTSTTVRITDGAGAPLGLHEVEVRQVQHELQFGSAAFAMSAESEEVQHLWLGLFDTATLPFYWGRYEPAPGQTMREELRQSARWFADRGVRLKGHPLVWHTVKAPWVDVLPLEEAEELLRGRIRREVTDFAGLVDSWDAINEVVIMPRFTNEPDGVPNAISRLAAVKGRAEMVRMAVTEARAGGTSPHLVINDFDLGPEYEQLIEEVLAAGVEIDAIGLQSHMHKGFKGEDYLLSACERFARFGLPLHWTETTVLSGEPIPSHVSDLNDHVVDEWPSTPEGEERQAEELVRHYTTLVSEPAVASITYWGFSDRDAWLNAPAGLVRHDGSPKPGYHALRDLVRGDWWLSPTTMCSDSSGRIAVEGFAGRYEITAHGSSGTFGVSSAAPEVTVALV